MVVINEFYRTLDPIYKRINIVIHKSSINICKREPGLEMYLYKVIGILYEQIPTEVCEDIADFFKLLGLDTIHKEGKMLSE